MRIVPLLLAFAFLIGLMGAVSWVFFGGSITSMMYTSALSIMISAGLVFSLVGDETPVDKKIKNRELVFIVLLCGLLLLFSMPTLEGYLTGSDLSFSQLLLVNQVAQLYEQNLEDMSFLPALSFSLLGIGILLFFLWPKEKRVPFLSIALALSLLLLALHLTSLITTLLGMPLMPFTQQKPTAIETSSAMLLIGSALSIGVFRARKMGLREQSKKKKTIS